MAAAVTAGGRFVRAECGVVVGDCFFDVLAVAFNRCLVDHARFPHTVILTDARWTAWKVRFQLAVFVWKTLGRGSVEVFEGLGDRDILLRLINEGGKCEYHGSDPDASASTLTILADSFGGAGGCDTLRNFLRHILSTGNWADDNVRQFTEACWNMNILMITAIRMEGDWQTLEFMPTQFLQYRPLIMTIFYIPDTHFQLVSYETVDPAGNIRNRSLFYVPSLAREEPALYNMFNKEPTLQNMFGDVVPQSPTAPVA